MASISFLSVSSGTLIGFNMVPYLHYEAHLSAAQAAGVLSLSTLCALTSLFWGAVADRWTPYRCLLGGLLGSAGVILFLTMVNSLSAAYMFGVLWGLVSSSQILIYMLLAHYYGQASYGSIAGAMRPFEAGGLGVGQSLGALLHDLTGNYRGMIFITCGTYVLTVLLMLLLRPPGVSHTTQVSTSSRLSA